MFHFEFVYRVISIIIATCCPLAMFFFFPEQQSLSAYWDTNALPLFVIMTAVTSHFMFSLDNWKIPAVFLLLLTAFPYTMFSILHDILALCFFISAGIAMFVTNRFRTLFVLYLFGCLLAIKNLLYGEIVSILCLCTFHGTILYYHHKLLYKKR